MTLVWSSKAIERVRAHRGAVGGRNCQRELPSAKTHNLKILKTPTQPTPDTCFLLVTAYSHAILVFIGRSLHLHNAFFSMVTCTSMQCLFFIVHTRTILVPR